MLTTGVFVVFPVIGFKFFSRVRPLVFLPGSVVAAARGFCCYVVGFCAGNLFERAFCGLKPFYPGELMS